MIGIERREHLILLGLCLAPILLSLGLKLNGQGVTLPGWANFTAPSTCIFSQLTGYQCPVCGLTRGLVALSHGRPQEAIKFHPSSLAVFIFLCLQIPYRLGFLSGNKFFRKPTRLSALPGILVAAGIMINWFVYLKSVL